MFQSGDENRYEPYPPDINAIIELAFREGRGNVYLDVDDGRFEVDFVRMVQEKVGSAGKAVKVKRTTNGL